MNFNFLFFQPGTYLFRRSRSEPKALVVAFSTTADVEQCLLKFGEEGWTLHEGSHVFPTLANFLARNCLVLHTPFVPEEVETTVYVETAPIITQGPPPTNSGEGRAEKTNNVSNLFDFFVMRARFFLRYF